MVLQLLYHGGPASRADLARATGLSRVSVSDLVNGLLKDGLVAETGQSTKGRVGKPGTLIALLTQQHQVIAIDLSDHQELHGAVLNLDGEIRARHKAAWNGGTGAHAIDLVAALCTSLAEQATRPVLGFGVAVPGTVDASGTVGQVANRDWLDVPLKDHLQDTLARPVHVANSADAVTVGEMTFGGADGAAAMVLTIDTGIGAGIVLDGRRVRGTGFGASEIGHLTVVEQPDAPSADVQLAGPRQCACGRTGCLETIVNVPTLSAHRGDVQALAAAGRHLGAALAPVVSALNLSEIVLAGPADLLDGALRLSARQTIRERVAPVVGDVLRLRMTNLGDDYRLRGAAGLVLASQLGVG